MAFSEPGYRTNIPGYEYLGSRSHIFSKEEDQQTKDVVNREKSKVEIPEEWTDYDIYIKSMLMDGDLFDETGANIDGNYRYSLWRIWDREKPMVMFIMLNPSTADSVANDRTVNRCINFANYWGYGGIYIGNLFAYRTKDPKEMKKQADPVGPQNNKYLKEMARKVEVVVFAWGNHGKYMGRDKKIIRMFKKGKCIGQNSNGSPKHPLYIAADLDLKEFKRL